MRVLVTGGRTFQDRDWLWAGLDLLHSKRAITEIIEGGATGADVPAASRSPLSRPSGRSSAEA